MKFYYYIVFEITMNFKNEMEEEIFIKGDGEFSLPDPIKSIDEINSIKSQIEQITLPEILKNYEINDYDIEDYEILLNNFIFLRSENYFKDGLK